MRKLSPIRSILLIVIMGFLTISILNFNAEVFAEDRSRIIFDFDTGSILVDKDEYIKPKYAHEPIQLHVSGTIEDYQRAESTILTITTPSGEIVENVIRPTREGEFDFLSLITNNDSVGFYEIHVIHKEVAIGPAVYKIIEEDSFSQPIGKTAVPEWVKNNAGWWAEGMIGNNDFVEGIEYLINESIIDVPPRTSGPETGSNEIPEWVKNNAGWWAEGQIQTEDFLKGIEFLVEQGIIKIV